MKLSKSSFVILPPFPVGRTKDKSICEEENVKISVFNNHSSLNRQYNTQQQQSTWTKGSLSNPNKFIKQHVNCSIIYN